MHPLVILHISAATIGLLSGAMSMIARKGASVHKLAGNIFFGSMLVMTVSAFYLAAFMHPVAANAAVATLTCYLICTGWWAAKRKGDKLGAFDYGAFVVILAVSARMIAWGIEAVNSVDGRKDSMPAAIYFVFGSIAFLFALGDVRMFFRGTLAGNKRLARHLWRMCFALLITALSFYPGQAKLFPQLRGMFLPYVPVILLVLSMFYWLIKVSWKRRARSAPLRPYTVKA